MTNTPGDGQPPQDPYQQPSGEPPAHPPAQPPYGQYGQPAQPPYGGQQYGQPPYGGPPPYAQPPGYPPAYAQDHPQATTSLVLGILGIVVCGILAPFAWRMGKRTVTEIDASNGQLGGRGAAQAGYVLGLIGSILLGLAVLFFLVLILLAIAGGLSTISTGSSTSP